LVLQEQKRVMKLAKEAYVANLSLKTIRVWRFIRSWLPESDVIKRLKTIRVWSSSESEVKMLELVKVSYFEDTRLQKEKKHGATTIFEELKGIGCLSTEERRKKDIVQLYNHYSTIMIAHNTATTGSTLVISLNKEWISNYSLLGQ